MRQIKRQFREWFPCIYTLTCIGFGIVVGILGTILVNI